MEYTIPITREVDKTLRIDKENRKVICENRGIYANPLRKGEACTPGILFSYYKETPQIPEKKGRQKYVAPKTIHDTKQFRPASLKKNLPFVNDKVTYGEDQDKINELLNKSLEDKSKVRPKFIPKLPEGSLQHDKKFKPSSLGKQVKL